MSDKKRRSPHTSIVVTGWKDGKPFHITEYSGSSLKAGTAFMRAIQKAQQDHTIEKVFYFEDARREKDGKIETVNNEMVCLEVRKIAVSDS